MPGSKYLMWSTKSGHRVKVVRCHNEVNDGRSATLIAFEYDERRVDE